MYLLYLDESGSHESSPALVVAGIAVHEHDAFPLQRRLEALLARKLPAGLNPQDFELHAAELKSPVRSVRRPLGDALAHPRGTWAPLLRLGSRLQAPFSTERPGSAAGLMMKNQKLIIHQSLTTLGVA